MNDHISKKDYTEIINLFRKQDWLIKKKSALSDLLDLAEKEDSKDLIFSLLNRFKYIYAAEKTAFYSDIFNNVSASFNEDKSIMAAITFDRYTDSGQQILYELSSVFNEKGWCKIKEISRLNRIKKEFNKGKDQIIIVDEFTGTGNTVISRNKFVQRECPGASIKFVFLVGVADAVKYAKDSGIDIYCAHIINKGISGYYKGANIKENFNKMLKLEESLAVENEGSLLVDNSLGHGEAEALYTSELGNTPNSVFPIFWWSRDKKGDVRNTILHRKQRNYTD